MRGAALSTSAANELSPDCVPIAHPRPHRLFMQHRLRRGRCSAALGACDRHSSFHLPVNMPCRFAGYLRPRWAAEIPFRIRQRAAIFARLIHGNDMRQEPAALIRIKAKPQLPSLRGLLTQYSKKSAEAPAIG